MGLSQYACVREGVRAKMKFHLTPMHADTSLCSRIPRGSVPLVACLRGLPPATLPLVFRRQSANVVHNPIRPCHRSATHADKRGPSDQWIGETPNNCEHYAQEGVGSSHFCPGGLAKTRSGCTRPCAEHVSLRLVNLLRRQCADHLPPALPYRHSRTALTGDEEREAGVLNPFPVGPGKEGGTISEADLERMIHKLAESVNRQTH